MSILCILPYKKGKYVKYFLYTSLILAIVSAVVFVGSNLNWGVSPEYPPPGSESTGSPDRVSASEQQVLESSAPEVSSSVGDEFAVDLPTEELNQIYAQGIHALGVVDELPTASERYLGSLSAAERGDARAQYDVSRALHFCNGVPRADAMEDVRENTSLKQAVKDAIEQQHGECIEVHRNVPRDEAEGAERKWFSRAFAQEYPLARLRDSLLENDPMIDKTALFLASLREEDPDIYEIMMVHISSQPTPDPIERMAWSLLRCKHDSVCDVPRFVRDITVGELPSQARLIFNRTSAIRTAIENKDWNTALPNNI